MAPGQASIAFENNADGIYLIDHVASGDPDKLIQVFNTVSAAYPHNFIGINFLGVMPEDALNLLDEDLKAAGYPDCRMRSGLMIFELTLKWVTLCVVSIANQN